MLMYIGSFKQKYAIKDVLSESYYPRERTMQCIFTVDDKSGDTNVIKTSIFPEGATISSDNEGRNLAYFCLNDPIYINILTPYNRT